MPGKVLSQQQIQIMQAQAKKLSVLQNLQHPETLLQMAANQNPLIANVMNYSKTNGMSYDAMTEMVLQQQGYDVPAVRQQLIDAGIICA